MLVLISHSGLLYKLHDLEVVGAVFDVIAGILSGRVQRVAVDVICNENVRVVSGVPQGCVLDPLLFFLYTSDFSIILKNTLVGYADDSTLLAEEPKSGRRLPAVLSLKRDLDRIGDFNKRW